MPDMEAKKEREAFNMPSLDKMIFAALLHALYVPYTIIVLWLMLDDAKACFYFFPCFCIQPSQVLYRVRS